MMNKLHALVDSLLDHADDLINSMSFHWFRFKNGYTKKKLKKMYPGPGGRNGGGLLSYEEVTALGKHYHRMERQRELKSGTVKVYEKMRKKQKGEQDVEVCNAGTDNDASCSNGE